MISIRREIPQDIDAVYTVNCQAFGRTPEADLVNTLRTREDNIISLVALENDKIVGHILFSPMTVEKQPENKHSIGLGPLAVLPGYQHSGIGSKLVRHGLDECRRNGFAVVAVLGHPAFYPRFGFTPSIKYAVKCEFDSPPEAFMLLELKPGALAVLKGQVIHYRPEFKDV